MAEIGDGPAGQPVIGAARQFRAGKAWIGCASLRS